MVVLYVKNPIAAQRTEAKGPRHHGAKGKRAAECAQGSTGSGKEGHNRAAAVRPDSQQVGIAPGDVESAMYAESA